LGEDVTENEIMNALFFWLFSGGMIVCALAVILNRNAVASALCFTFAIVFMSGLFIMLSAFFLAAVQIIVTAGAVMVLFLFIIMLMDLSVMEHMPRQKIWMGFTLVLALAFLVIVAKVLYGMPIGAATMASMESKAVAPAQSNPAYAQIPRDETTSTADKQDDTHRIGRLLFATNTSTDPVTGLPRTSYVAPFEVTSLLILIATIGVIVLCKQGDRPRSTPRDELVREAPPVAERKEPALKI
jgi:NADH-quinone oxidoreductase subunit J